MDKKYQESLIAQMDSLEEGQYFSYWIDKECYLIVKLKGKN